MPFWFAVSGWLVDAYVFPGLQTLLVVVLSVVLLLDLWGSKIGGRSTQIHRGTDSQPPGSLRPTGDLSIQIHRGTDAMGKLYGIWATASGLLVTICLGVESDHRVLFVVLDVLIVTYVCLFSPWFRNKLIGWAHYLPSVEKR